MPTYKLTYFNSRGFGEPCRMVMAAAGQKFEDVRLEREQWQKMKESNSTPQGKLPILEVDGKVIPQSGAIARYLARTFGMYPNNIDDITAVEVLLCSVEDLWDPFRKMVYEQDEAKKAEAKKKMEEEVIPCFLKYCEKMLKDNGGEFLVGKQLSLADIAFYTSSEQLMKFEDCLKPYPSLIAHREKISSIPNIKAYLSKRPETEY